VRACVRMWIDRCIPQDNPGGGAPGDGTVILELLIAQRVSGVGYASIWDPQVRKRVFLRHFILNMIILPRQARNKRRENSKKRRVFL
jgi:hypothetical protein